MIATNERLADDVAPAPANARILGLDLARALAMGGMLLVHYVWPDGGGSAIDLLATAMSGRAMPLFMMLGGVGVTLSTQRSQRPDLTLVVRGIILFNLGLILNAGSEWVAVVLQSYGLLFVLAPLLRRIRPRITAPLSVAVAAIGAWSYQVFGGSIARSTAFGDFGEPVNVVRSLLVDGFYPLFPVASFFIAGIAIGRLDLRSPQTAKKLSVAGLVVGIGVVAAAYVVGARFGIAEPGGTFAEGGFSLDRFSWERLLIKEGHSQMPTWVFSALGTSMFVLGLSLLVAPHTRRLISPLLSLGRLALTFYVFQVVLTKVVTTPDKTSFPTEVATVGLIYLSSTVFAHWWTRRFRFGPLEALLRVDELGQRHRHRRALSAR